MGQILRRFIPRAPRYVLSPNDDQLMRVAPGYGRDTNAVLYCRLVNLSESGAALLMDPQSAPQLGEVIKVELPVPGGGQIAWWGEVVRSEFFEPASWWSSNENPTDERMVMVALHFENLPEGHRHSIRKGLHDRFLAILRERRRKQWLYWRHWAVEHARQILIYVVAAAVSFGLLYWLSQPSGNYDPSRGTLWGDRFQSLNFNKSK